MAGSKNVLSANLSPKSCYFVWRAFAHMARVYGIKFTFNPKGEIGFEREQFMRLMDLYTLLYNNIYVDGPTQVVGFRTERLRPGTHLLSTFMLFEDRYSIESRFDDNGKTAWFDSEGFLSLVNDILYWNGYGGPMVL